jgi:hypothetical protein
MEVVQGCSVITNMGWNLNQVHLGTEHLSLSHQVALLEQRQYIQEWCTPIIPEHRRLREKDGEFQASLS